MTFFKQLAEIGNVDVTMRIMQKGDKLTMNIMPGSSKSTNQPFNITGTGEELDEAFFSTVFPGVQEIKGLVHNLSDVKEDLKKKEKPAPVAKKEEKKKDKPGKKTKPAADKKEVSLFEAEVPTGSDEAPEEITEEGTDNDVDQDEQTES